MNRRPAYSAEANCLLLLLVMFTLMCVVPFFLLEAAQLALTKLHLSPALAVLVLVAIFTGGLVNLPVGVVEGRVPSPEAVPSLYRLMEWVPMVRPQRTRTIVAVNVGGCLVPVLLALFELSLVMPAGPQARWALLCAVLANVAVCYFVARPVPGVGIAMPAFASPAVSVLVTWLLLMPDEFAMIRAPVAFVAGVTGPLVGADLLHLRDITKISASVVSIGGAGTFDGIVLSGLLAAFLV